MALSDKNILITPNIGQSADPKIVFSGADASTAAQNITLNVYPTDNGTLSFEGSAGQLFSISNSLSGTIYSVNDVSGIPSIEVLDTGLIKLGQYGGNVILGTGTDTGEAKLQVTGGGFFTGSIGISRTTKGVYAGLSSAGDPQIQLQGNGASNPHIDFDNGTGDYDMRIILSGDDTLTVTGGYLQVDGSARSPIFYDSDNTGYYADPSGSSRFSSIVNDEVYNYGWFRNYDSLEGLYNQANGNHWYSDSGNYWSLTFAGNTSGGIRFRSGHQSTALGYVYADTGYSIGFLNQDGNWRLRVVGGDYSLADGSSMRAQIYYDSNDTNYYCDPNGTSRLNTTNITTLQTYGNSNLGDGNGDTTWVNDILYVGASDSGDSHFYLGENSSSWYGDHWYWDSGYTLYRYSRYAGTDSLIHYHDTRDASRITYGRNIVFNDYGKGIVGSYSSTRYQGVFSMGDSYKLPADGTTTGSLYGLAWSHPNAGGVAGNLNTHGLLAMENGTWLASLSGSVRARDDMRAPIFYDNNDTGYYCNPNSDSRLYQTITTYTRFGTDTNKGYADGWNTYSSQLHKIARITFDWNGNYDSENHGIFSTDINGSYSDDISINSFSDINLRIDSNNNDSADYVRFHHHTTGNNQFAYMGYNGSNYESYFSGITYTPDMRADIYYDRNNTGYYCDPSSGSYFYSLSIASSSSVRYADVAEKYTADAQYEPGTILCFGGDKEVTISTESHIDTIAGIVSTKPAWVMNAELKDEFVTDLALIGRVPCRVQGPIKKGQKVVASDIPGVGCAMDKSLYEPGCVVGKALEDIETNEVKTIEVVVGKL